MVNRKIVLSLLISLIVVNLLVIIALPGSATRLLLSDVCYLLLAAVVLLCLWFAARQAVAVSPQLAVCWWLLFASHLLDLVADIIWVYDELVLQINPFPSLADFFYLASYPVFLAAIVYLVEKDRSNMQNVSTWLDAGLVFVSAFLFLWIILLNPLLESAAGEPLLNQFLNIAYPVGDLMLITALLIVIYKRSARTMTLPLVLLSVSMLMKIISDLFFSYQSLAGTYVSGGWIDIGWLVGYGFVGLAAYYQSVLFPAEKDKWPVDLKKDPRWLKTFNTYRNLLPYILAVGALLFAQFGYKNALYTNAVLPLICVWSILIIVFLRQYLSLRENSRLNRKLQSAFMEIQEKAQNEREMNKRLLAEIKQRKELEKQLKHSALHDALTGLPNRTLFMDRLQHALAYSKRNPAYNFSIFFIDLNHFKQVNDNLGHAYGDKALVHFSDRLNKTLRRSDTLARLGGDEFAILVENSSSNESLIQVAERIRECARMTYKLRGKAVNVSASIGLVRDGRNYSSAEEILNDADIAMYRAKDHGNEMMMIFEPHMRE